MLPMRAFLMPEIEKVNEMKNENRKRKAQARRAKRQDRKARTATPKTDASRERRNACTDACEDTCQAEFEAMLGVMGEIEAMGGNVTFANSNTGESWGDDDKTATALMNLNVMVVVKDLPIVWVRQTDNGPTIDFDEDTILKLVKDGQQGASRIGLVVDPLMGDVPFHISLKSTHSGSRGTTILEVVRTGRTSWFDWSPDRLGAIRERASGGDYGDGIGQLELAFGDIADATIASDIPCVDEAEAC